MKVPILLLLLAVILFKNECIGQRTTPPPIRPALAQNVGPTLPTRTTPKAGGAGRPTSQKTTPGRSTTRSAQSGRLVVTPQANANGRTTPRGGNPLQRTTARTNQGTSARTTFAAGRTTPRMSTGSGRTTPRGASGITTARNAKLQQTTTKRGAGGMGTTTRRLTNVPFASAYSYSEKPHGPVTTSSIQKYMPYGVPYSMNSPSLFMTPYLYSAPLRFEPNKTDTDNSTTTSTMATATMTTVSFNASSDFVDDGVNYYDTNTTTEASGNHTDEWMDHPKLELPVNSETSTAIAEPTSAPTRKKLKRKKLTSTTAKARLLKRRKKIVAVTEAENEE